MPETQARLRYVRISPTKARPVLALIRGQDIMTARDTLRLSDRAVSREIAKLLESAVANAEHNNHVLEDELFVARAFADEGPTMKRWRPRARGRGVRIRNRASHITIVLDRYSDEQLELRRRREVESGRPARRRPLRRRRPRAVAEEEHDHEHDLELEDLDEEAIEADEYEELEAEAAAEADEADEAEVDEDTEEAADEDEMVAADTDDDADAPRREE